MVNAYTHRREYLHRVNEECNIECRRSSCAPIVYHSGQPTSAQTRSSGTDGSGQADVVDSIASPAVGQGLPVATFPSTTFTSASYASAQSVSPISTCGSEQVFLSVGTASHLSPSGSGHIPHCTSNLSDVNL
ncbi:hypothetical protein CDAR_19331 [Caerostris darwini]|uniref:Uncharacterized protein n=1 Tax=Caerostris darwini TaxID=1538125 RepID=A0AAV4WCA8_9ARAC|nr:hypothetical protein CDAR_19331 [Caerostris darwini]